MEMKPCTIVYDHIHYRPAGFRAPRKHERYIRKDGHVGIAVQNFPPDVKRMIVCVKLIEELEAI